MSSSSAISTNIAVIYSKKAYADMFKSTALGYATVKGIIKETDELKGKRGSQINFSKLSILSGKGTGGTGALVGNEEALNNSTQTMRVAEFCHAVLNPSELKLETHETYINWNDETASLLTGWAASREDAGFFQQLAGAYSTSITVDGATYSGADRTHVVGRNTVITPTSNRIVRAGGAGTDQGLGSSNTITLDLVDDAITLLESNYPSAETDDEGFLHLFISHEQARDLIQDSSGRAQLYTIGLNQIAGGKDSVTIFDSGFSGNKSMRLIGTYRNVKIWACKRVAKGVNSSTSAEIPAVQRAVLCGKDAATYASYFGKYSADDVNTVPVRMSNQLSDYGRYKGTSIHMIDGLIKNQGLLASGSFEDQAVVVISTYGA